ncbi:hypothetical protein LJC22_03165 [Desulfosarcina sp. OttesenSCG-928-G10]|nr:hypothetical protein [Desulfosarcina sp. OttesenSCG-928-G10]
MNTQTLILTVLVFWLIMGLAFLSAWSEVKRTGGAPSDLLKKNETFLFMASLLIGLVIIGFNLSAAP